MNKKILSLVLALVMVLGTFANVFAAETTKKAEDAKKEAPKAGEKVEKIVGKDNKIQYIVDKKIVEGYEDGSMGYDKNITRAEITRLLVVANGNEALAKQLQGSMKIYSDVDTKHWANGVITVGTTKPSDSNGIAMLAGYPDKSFKPEANVTYAELAKMLVVLVKKDLTADMVKNAIWASSWMTWAAQLGILDDVTVADSNAAATRADAFVMLYNALYKMQNFKRVPANDKVGVLSYLNKNGKLVLNQDEKEQAYTITADTVFVNSYKENKKENSNIVRVKDIVNPDYYLGSLVRIITNDKKEVTHILELGNPKEMALSAEANKVTRNSRWNGIADYTVETGVSDIAKLGTKGDDVYNGWAKIEFKSNDTRVKQLVFQTRTNSNVATVSVNSDTKVYVANPYNNIMREVKNINEAMSLIGYNSSRWEHVPNVYAGFNQDGRKSVVDAFNQADRNIAKVIVFNVVAKTESGNLYRVVNQANYPGNATLEDTDGKLVEKNFLGNMGSFPYNYADLFDVISVKYVNRGYYDNITTSINHDDTKLFPIVKVIGFGNDKRSIDVEDVYGDKATIDVRDADIFNAKQYKDLQKGDLVQFRTENGNKKPETTVIDVLSILPRETGSRVIKAEGSIQGILINISARTRVGYVLETSDADRYVTIKEYRDNMDIDARTETKHYQVTESEIEQLKYAKANDIKVQYEVKSTDDRNVDGRAYNFTVNGKSLDKFVAEDQAAKAKAAAKEALEAKIAEAEAKAKGVIEAQDGSNVLKTQKWATKETLDQYKADIATAKEVLAKSSSTTDQLNEAKETLNGKIGAFNPAVGEKLA